MRAGAEGRRARPSVLVVAGLEPLGRAGLLADVGALSRAGVHPAAVASALTAQGTRTFAVSATRPALLATQLRAVQERVNPNGVKLGLVVSRAQLEVVLDAVARVGTLVVDPVVRTSRGEPLSRLKRGDFWGLGRARRGVILTPNRPELAWLTGTDDPEAGGAALVAEGFSAVVVKGGHAEGSSRVGDVLVTPQGAQWMWTPRLSRRAEQRGTGCRHASALAARLALGETLPNAAREAQREVVRYLRGGVW